MGLSLYEIDDEYKTVLADLESMDDIDQETIDNTMSTFKDNLERKCLAVGAFIKNLNAEAKAIKDAKDSLAARQKSIESKAKRMREYLAAHLPGKISDAQTRLSLLKGREKIVVDNIDLLPDSCIKLERKIVADSVGLWFDELPEGAAHKEVSAPSVMIK